MLHEREQYSLPPTPSKHKKRMITQTSNLDGTLPHTTPLLLVLHRLECNEIYSVVYENNVWYRISVVTFGIALVALQMLTNL